MITTIGLGILGGTLLGFGYVEKNLDLVAGGLVLVGLALGAGAVWALQDYRRRR